MRDHLPGGGGEIAVEQACRARGLHCAGPVALRFGERQEVELERRLDQPGGEVGAFDVEADPVEAGCRARQHHRRPPSWSTQVSLVPPPWLELTTSEPSVSATRVRPPGTMVLPVAPVRLQGRRTTWRGSSATGRVGETGVRMGR